MSSSPYATTGLVGQKDMGVATMHIDDTQNGDLASPVNEPDVDPIAERKLKWKLDLFILPLISAVYFFASMGRSDLGNAKIAGLSDELELSARDYSNAATMFLVGYIVFQLPGTLLIKRIRGPVQFSVAMMMWGMLTAVTVVIKSNAQLLALRFLIGVCEAFVQGALFYLSFWYKYSELATRGAIVWSMSTLAGACNGLIAYGIVKDLDGVNGWRAWRWIFLIEGVLPVAFSFVILLLLPESPQKVRFGFSAVEKRRIMQRSRASHNTEEQRLIWKQVPLVLLDLHFWLFCLLACCSHFCLGSLSNFFPDIIQGFGFDSVNAQGFTVVVYLCGGIGDIFWARIADKTNARALTMAVSVSGAVVGYAILIAVSGRNIQFFATCLVAFSMYPNIVLHLAWVATAFPGYTRRGSVLAFTNVFSQLFAICGTQAYSDPPLCIDESLADRQGHSIALGLSICSLITSIVLRWYLGFLNDKKSKAPLDPQMSAKSADELGDKHPDFYYTL